MHHERIAILDYGSQYTRLITRRLRDLGAFGLVYGPNATAAEIAGADLAGVILSGGPKSVMEAGAPTLDPAILELGVPILGVCYGMQLLARDFGGLLHRSSQREYGKAAIELQDPESVLFQGLDPVQQVWMSHGDHVEKAPDGYTVTAHTASVPVAAIDWIAAERDYVRLHTAHRSFLIRQSIGALAERLDPAQFIRIHRSSLVRADRIVRIRQAAGRGAVILSTGAEVAVSRRHMGALKAMSSPAGRF